MRQTESKIAEHVSEGMLIANYDYYQKYSELELVILHIHFTFYYKIMLPHIPTPLIVQVSVDKHVSSCTVHVEIFGQL